VGRLACAAVPGRALTEFGPGPTDRERRGALVARVALLLLVVAAGLTAAVLSWRRGNEEARERERDLTTTASDVVDTRVREVLASLAGAGGLVAENGTVARANFETFAVGVLGRSPLEALAYAPVVDDAARASYEASAGWPITDRDSGEVRPAARREQYAPVTMIVPLSQNQQSLLGFDLFGDPARGAAAVAARDTAQIVFTERVAAQPSGQPAVFVVQPLFRPAAPTGDVGERRAAIAGFLASAYPGASLLADIGSQLPGGTRVSVHDDTGLLATTEEPPRGGTAATIDIAGRSWEVVVEDTRGPSRTVPWLLVVVTALGAVALLALYSRADRYQRELTRSAEVVRRLAVFSQQLSRAASVAEVADIVSRHGAAVTGAVSAAFGIVDREAGRLRLFFGDDVLPEVADRYEDIPLSADIPVAEAVREGRLVAVGAPEEWRRYDAAGLARHLQPLRIGTIGSFPLRDESSAIVACLSMAWRSARALDDPQARSTFLAAAELCEETVNRALRTDESTRQAMAMADLAARLSTCRTLDHVGPTISAVVPEAVGAAFASVGVVDETTRQLRMLLEPQWHDTAAGRRYTTVPLDGVSPASTAMRRRTPVFVQRAEDIEATNPRLAADMRASGTVSSASLPLTGSDGRPLGLLMVAWNQMATFDDDQRTQLSTVAELCEQTVERARLYEHEHQLASDLQRHVLAPLPPIRGLRSAARYLPATRSLGMGGDWYEGVVLAQDRLAVVVGDVAGHGVDAVAEMARLRSTVSALLRAGLPPEQVLERTSEFVQGDGIMAASAALAVIDTAAGTLTYVVAGHPPPLLRRPDGTVEVLDDGRRPLLGVPGKVPVPAARPFPEGSVLVAYTDGLIERRGERLDASVERLAAALGAMPRPDVDDIADRLVLRVGDVRDVDDDVALVVLSPG